MTARQPCPSAPGPLEDYAAEFDVLFSMLGQRRSFREYLTGLLLPRDRNKTLTALAGPEPLTQAQTAAVQRLQYLLAEAAWDAELVTARRIALLMADRLTAPHAEGVLVIDDTGDRKDGSATAHVARQYLGSVGKIDNGIVAVTSLWADARCYYPLHVEPYTLAARLAKGKSDPAFRTKPVIARELIGRAREAGIPFRAVVADSFYGENGELEETLVRDAVPYVLGRKANLGHWASAEEAHTFHEAARRLRRSSWTTVVRRFADGHRETWWAAELTIAGYRPSGRVRAVVATTDRAALPPLSTWYLTTNCSRQDAPLAAIVRLYGLRVWVEEGYKRVKHELGWADFQGRSDRAIRRHWALVSCAFSFCWWHEGRSNDDGDPTAQGSSLLHGASRASTPTKPPAPSQVRKPARGENRLRETSRRRPSNRLRHSLASRTAPRAGMARPVAMAHALLAGVVDGAPSAGSHRAHRERQGRPRSQSLSPMLTNYR